MDCHFAFFHLFSLFDLWAKIMNWRGSGCVGMRDYFKIFVKMYVFRKIIRNKENELWLSLVYLAKCGVKFFIGTFFQKMDAIILSTISSK